MENRDHSRENLARSGTDKGRIDVELNHPNEVSHGKLKEALLQYLDEQDKLRSRPRTQAWKNKIVSNVFSTLNSDSETAQKIRGSYYRPTPDGFISFFGESSYLSFRESFRKDCPLEYALGRINPYTGHSVNTKDDYELYCLAHYLRLYSEDQLMDFKAERDLYFSELQQSREDVLRLEYKLSHPKKHFSPISALLPVLICVCLFLCVALYSRPTQSEFSAVSHAYSEAEQKNVKLMEDISALQGDIQNMKSHEASAEEAYKAGFLQALAHSSDETWSSDFFSAGRQFSAAYGDIIASYFDKWSNP